MITGSVQKKPYIFRFLYCLLLSDFDGFYTTSVGFFDDYGVCPFSGYNFFAVFISSVNNYILSTNSTEISGFSVLLRFWRLSNAPYSYCNILLDEKEALVVSSNCFRRLGKPHDMHLETASMIVFSMKNAITIKVGTCAIETELANTGGSDERMA